MSFHPRSILLVALLTAGCGGGGGYGGDDRNPPPPPPPPAGNASFTPFIKSQLAQTSDTAEPTDVNRDFNFDDESETAFDDVLQ